jgi:hypothetical protein
MLPILDTKKRKQHETTIINIAPLYNLR